MRRAKSLSLLPALGVASAFAVASSSNVMGLYKRDSLVCGGPGSADDPAALSCTLIFEDRLLISASDEPSEGSDLAVSFHFHYDVGDYCGFDGIGQWANDALTLRSNHKPLPTECRLSISFSDSIATVSDVGDACRASLCTALGPSIDGLKYEKAE
jgi:hypothetical protein